jgi:hypothetical protein
MQPLLDIRKPQAVVSVVRKCLGRMAAAVVRAIDQDAADAGGAHLAGGDLWVR